MKNKEVKNKDLEKVNGGKYKIPEEDRDYYLDRRCSSSKISDGTIRIR